MKFFAQIIFFLVALSNYAVHATTTSKTAARLPLDLTLDSKFDRDPILDGPRHRVIYRGVWDESHKNFRMSFSNEAEMNEEMHKLKFISNECALFESSRELALAGISAGSVLYFVPKKNVFFWEDRSGNEHVLEADNFWMNPIVSGFVSKLFIRMQQDLKESDGVFMGSEKAGTLLMVVLNPAEAFSNKFNALAGQRIFRDGETVVVSKSPERVTIGAPDDPSSRNYIGLRFRVRF